MLAVLLLALALMLSAGPAGAQSNDERFVDVELDLLRSIENVSVVPVRVSVVSSRAIDGTLVVEGRNSRVDWEFPIAVAANSEVGQVVMLPVTFSDLVVEARLVVGGEEVASDELRVFENFGNQNVAGLLGLEAPADSVELVPGEGRATLLELDDLELLPSLDTVVAAPAGLRSLSADELDRLLVWIAAGRQLVVADRPGSVDGLLPEVWSSSRATVVADAGLIHYAGSGWSDALPPGLAAATGSFDLVGFGGADQQELLSDAGFGVLGLGMLAAILVAYLVIAGPIAFGVLRGMEQMTKAWIVLPALAVVFTVGVVVAGNVTTGGRGDGYAAIVEVSPGGSAITESILVAREGRRTVELPSGTAVLASGIGIGRGAGSPVVLQPTRQSTDLVFDVDVGSGGTAVLARYTTDNDDLLTVEVVEANGSQVSGVVRNGSSTALEKVVVVIGPHFSELDRINAGQDAPFTIELGERGARRTAPELRAWEVEDWFGFDGLDRDHPEVTDGPVNASAWIDWRSTRLGTALPQGVVTAVGWTRDLDVSLLGGRGRTALVARAPVGRVDGEIHPDLVRSLPGWLPPMGAFVDAPIAIEAGRAGRIHRFVRPEEGDATGLAVEVNPSVTEVQVWVDGDWSAFALSDAGQLTVAIDDDLWNDDVLWLRSVPSDVFDPFSQLVELTVADSETLPGELMPPGVRSPRAAQFDPGAVPDAFPFGAALGTRTEVTLEDDVFTGSGELSRTYDVWAVELVEGQEVTVTMNAVGGNLDPLLIVRGPNGEIRAENDDFRGLDSRVDFVALDSGVYEIETRPLGEFDQFGVYEVTISVDGTGEEGS